MLWKCITIYRTMLKILINESNINVSWHNEIKVVCIYSRTVRRQAALVYVGLFPRTTIVIVGGNFFSLLHLCSHRRAVMLLNVKLSATALFCVLSKHKKIYHLQ